jgi:hypothetical protein
MSHPHFAGSLPLAGAEEVFRWAGTTLGDHAHLVPDGETGEQRKGWQAYIPWFERNPTLLRLPDVAYGSNLAQRYTVKEGVEPAFDEPFQFADWARESYATFLEVREAGGLPAHAKFLVTLPDPIDSVSSTVPGEAFYPVYEAYAKQVEISVADIAAAIPHEDLAIQWDIPTAACLWSGDVYGPDDQGFQLRELVRHGNWVPQDVDLGFHLCFGDGNEPGNVSEPRADEELVADATGLTALCNDLVSAMGRPIQFLHLPTLAHWVEPEHFAPLKGLEIGDTDLSLGVINLRRDRGLENGVERTRRRTAVARAEIGDTFGISSACGLGRYTPEQFAAAGALYRELTD